MWARASISLTQLLYMLAALAASAAALASIAPIIDRTVREHEILLLSRAIIEGDHARLSLPATLRETPIYVAENCTAYKSECSDCVKTYAVLVNLRDTPAAIRATDPLVLLGSSAIVLPDICGTQQLVVYRVEGGECTSNSFRIIEWVVDGSFVIGWLNASGIRYRLVLCSE